MKSVIWAGCAFNDHYFISTKNGVKHEADDGGIYNCKINGVENLYDNVGFDEAKFVINKYGTESDVSFKHCVKFTEKDICGKADWLHIAYIDALPNLDLSKLDKSRYGKISCDFCNSFPNPDKKRIIENLHYCDFIFDNYNGQLPWYYYEHSNSVHILHNPSGSLLIDKTMACKECCAEKKYKFTVSAGDRFAAAFIEASLKGLSLTKCQAFAHRKVKEWLEGVNENL